MEEVSKKKVDEHSSDYQTLSEEGEEEEKEDKKHFKSKYGIPPQLLKKKFTNILNPTFKSTHKSVPGFQYKMAKMNKKLKKIQHKHV